MNSIKVTHCRSIEGLEFLSRPEFKDERGSLIKVFSKKDLSIATNREVRQTLISRNALAGTLRGFHWQVSPYQDAKLLFALKGSFFLAVLDLRADSGTFLTLTHRQLSASTNYALFVPEGCATAYLTLEDNSDILYHLFHDFDTAAARGFIWNDPDVACPWPIQVKIISEKDQKLPKLTEMLSFP